MTVERVKTLPGIAHNVYGLQQVGEIEFLSARTVAKFIIKSSLLLLSLNKDFSARTIAETFTNAHC